MGLLRYSNNHAHITICRCNHYEKNRNDKNISIDDVKKPAYLEVPIHDYVRGKQTQRKAVKTSIKFEI